MSEFNICTVNEKVLSKLTKLSIPAFANFYHEVTQKHQKRLGFQITADDQKTLDQCLKPEDRGKIMTWDS